MTPATLTAHSLHAQLQAIRCEAVPNCAGSIKAVMKLRASHDACAEVCWTLTVSIRVTFTQQQHPWAVMGDLVTFMPDVVLLCMTLGGSMILQTAHV